MSNPKPSRVTAVKTPGVTTQPPAADQDDQVTDADALAENFDDVALPAAAPAAAAPAAALPPDLASIVAQEVAKALAAQRGGPSMPQAQSLPDQRDVDPKKITEITLSKQGYVIPHGYGATPAHLRNTNIGV